MKRVLTVALVFLISLLADKAVHAAQYETPKTGLQATLPPYIAPTVLSPAPGQRFYANAFFPLKLAPPQGMDVAEYLVSLEKKDASGNWIAYTKDPMPVSGPRAQSAEGYNGFSLPAGAWRLTVLAFRPTQSRWSPWVEFSVIAAPLSPARLGTKLSK